MTKSHHRTKWRYITVFLVVAAFYVLYAYRLNIEYFNKTTIGPLGGSYYVVLDKDPNTLILPDDKYWVGKSRNQSETVIISDKGVTPFSWRQALRAHSVVVCFRAERVYVCECSRLRRGYYSRMEVTIEEQTSQRAKPNAGAEPIPTSPPSAGMAHP